MTVPGVNVICAAIFLAAVGDIRRFNGRARWSPTWALTRASTSQAQAGTRRADLQTGLAAERAGRWSKPPAQSPSNPGRMHAFYERIRARKGHNTAVVAVARKLAVLFYCMLTREEDYAHQQPSLTELKLRRLEITAGAPTRKGKPSGVWATRERMRQAEKQLAAAGRGLLQALDRRLARHAPKKRRRARA